MPCRPGGRSLCRYRPPPSPAPPRPQSPRRGGTPRAIARKRGLRHDAPHMGDGARRHLPVTRRGEIVRVNHRLIRRIARAQGDPPPAFGPQMADRGGEGRKGCRSSPNLSSESGWTWICRSGVATLSSERRNAPSCEGAMVSGPVRNSAYSAASVPSSPASGCPCSACARP